MRALQSYPQGILKQSFSPLTMTRKKVTLAYIANDSARKATFKKRKKGLVKKVSELSTLCGIEACAIVYSPYDTEPEVWPSPSGARRTIARFRNMSEMDQSKRMMNQQNFLGKRIWKAEEQLKKQHRDNREKEVTQVMYQALTRPEESLQGLSIMDLKDLNWVLDKTVKDIDEKVKSLQKPPPPPLPPNNSNLRTSQTHHVSAGIGDRTNNNNGNNITKSEDPTLGHEHGIDGALDVGIDAMLNPPWYMEMLKPAEGLLGFSRFDNNIYNTNDVNSNDMMMMMLPPPPPPQAAATTTTTYPCPSQNGVPWSNFFFP